MLGDVSKLPRRAGGHDHRCMVRIAVDQEQTREGTEGRMFFFSVVVVVVVESR